MPRAATLAKPAQQQQASPADTKSAASPARHDLAELKMDLRDAERAALAARAPVARLEAEIADEAAARALLAELDGDYAARIAEWAASGSAPGAAPEPRGDRHEAEATLEAAALKAEAARNALSAVRQRIAAPNKAGPQNQLTGSSVQVQQEPGIVAPQWKIPPP